MPNKQFCYCFVFEAEPHNVALADHEVTSLVSASCILGLQEYTTMPGS